MFNFKEILSVTLILFSVIDILGSIPIVIDLRKKVGHVQSGKATLVAGILMILFLFVGDNLLGLFGIDVGSFAIAGAIIMFIIGMEMILGRSFFKNEPVEGSNNTSSIVPIAFPLIAGAGTLTTIVSIKAEYSELNILVGIVVNLAFVYLVLKSTNWLEKKIGAGGISVLQKVFGIILLSIAIKLFKDNIINL
ncbi:MarC family protein [uncultured Roseivirga sp.]|uniref:MarC family protein n=1 Tax=uncultured Roseivirga sp. TaxID=543088 RepID=UPI0030DA72D2|tara:strand:- start:2175 stop:2753 length:579 start_codon:yes stop_codon:yes gene_type:complete